MRLQDIVVLFEGRPADKHDVEIGLGDLREWAAENERLQSMIQGYRDEAAEYKVDNAQLRAERDNWEAVCSGSIKEQFRLARENEARLKLALDQLDKAAAEIERLRADKDVQRSQERNTAYEKDIAKLEAESARLQAALAVLWHAYDTDNRPPHQVVKIAKECYERGAIEQGRKK